MFRFHSWMKFLGFKCGWNCCYSCWKGIEGHIKGSQNLVVELGSAFASPQLDLILRFCLTWLDS